MPVEWDELDDVTPFDFTVRTAGPRFAELGDLHAGIDDTAYDISPLLEWYERDERDLGWRHALPARLPEDARRAQAGAAEPSAT